MTVVTKKTDAGDFPTKRDDTECIESAGCEDREDSEGRARRMVIEAMRSGCIDPYYVGR